MVKEPSIVIMNVIPQEMEKWITVAKGTKNGDTPLLIYLTQSLLQLWFICLFLDF